MIIGENGNIFIPVLEERAAAAIAQHPERKFKDGTGGIEGKIGHVVIQELLLEVTALRGVLQDIHQTFQHGNGCDQRGWVDDTMSWLVFF